MTRGVLYLASGSSYIEQAKLSARSLKRHNPSVPITLYTDEDVVTEVFDQVISIDKPIREMGDSILTQDHFPYERNLYLDCDTYVCDNIEDLFDLLDEYELAMAHNAGGSYWNANIYYGLDIDIPFGFAEYNTGVIAYKDSKTVRELFTNWNDKYAELDVQTVGNVDYKTNQPALRVALYGSTVNLVTLTPEYNFQMNHHRYARGKIKILHNSGELDVDLDQLSDIVNSLESGRVITQDDFPWRVTSESHKSKSYWIKYIIDDRFGVGRSFPYLRGARDTISIARSLFPGL